MQPIDLSAALKATDGDVELLAEVVEAFLDEYPDLLTHLEPALAERNLAHVQRISHTIKGGLRLFGNVPSHAFAERLEEMGASGCLENGAETLESLKSSLALLRGQLLDALKNLSC